MLKITDFIRPAKTHELYVMYHGSFAQSISYPTDVSDVFLLFLSQAHLVAAFEKSLGNMTGRLQSLTMTAEQKVCLQKQALECGT